MYSSCQICRLRSETWSARDRLRLAGSAGLRGPSIDEMTEVFLDAAEE
jgi:hypothetical protein